MDARCAGPNSGFCADSETVASCTDGAYEELLCDPDQHCEDAGGAAACVDDAGDDDDSADTGDDDDSAGDGDDDDDLTPPDPTPITNDESCSCRAGSPTGSAAAPVGLVVTLLFVLGVPLHRRRR